MAEAEVVESTGFRWRCSCGTWSGRIYGTPEEADRTRELHEAAHAAVEAGYERVGPIGVHSFAMHRHGPGHQHAHDGGADPHQHGGPR